MALPSIADLKMWVGILFTKDDWDYNFSQLVSWLADGNSDLVVNSVKTTNGLDLDGAQINNVGAATSGSQAINLDQANTILNRSSYYYPFSVASGKVDSDGNSAYLQKDSDTQVTVLAGNVNPDLVCIQSDGTVESVTSNTVLTVPVTNGTYHIIKEKGKAISLTSSSSGKVTIDKDFPATQNTGDYFLDNSVVPFKGYKYGLSGWTETEFCYLGYVTVSSGTATLTKFDYNYNRFDINNSAESRLQSIGWGMPDYSRAVEKTNNTEYQAETDGYIVVIRAMTNNGGLGFGIGYASNTYSLTFVLNSNVVSDCFCTIPISKGMYYKSLDINYERSTMTYYFVPVKGE